MSFDRRSFSGSVPVLLATVIIAVGFISTEVQSQVILDLKVADVTAYPAQTNVKIPIYMANYTDTVTAFQIWLQFSRPDLAEFTLGFDTTGKVGAREL